MKVNLIAFLLTTLVTIVTGKLIIPILKKLKVGQTILHYVKEHKGKEGTPTMGGLFAILSPTIIYFIFFGFSSRLSVVSISIGLAFLIVGFLDDFIKIKFKKNEGLKAYQKIFFQLFIAVFAGVFAYVNELTLFYIPFTKITVNLGVFTIPVVIFIFLAITNSVNLTDGLDGLAGSVSAVYLIFLAIIIYMQMSFFQNVYLQISEYNGLISLIVCLVGGLMGFLLFNVSKAKVFMGDTGSLAIGGFIGAISVFSLNSFFIPILGIMFVLSSISVIVQVLYYKKTKKRVFLMAPLHHHFQHKGYTETQISYCYSLFTFVVGVICVIGCL